MKTDYLKTVTYSLLKKEFKDIIPEYKFHPTRKWRFDFAIPLKMIAIEIEGGTFSNGRHSRPLGMQADMEKYNQAALSGWKVLRYTPQQWNAAIPYQDLVTFANDNKQR